MENILCNLAYTVPFLIFGALGCIAGVFIKMVQFIKG